ncbi:MAG: HD domain-containing protein [Bacilli bacterium]|nr:HD domain-containing protein [Bacilli bacterium]
MLSYWYNYYTDKIVLALEIANDTHKDQKDGIGVPYILHPYRVAAWYADDMSDQCPSAKEFEECYIIALLHDTIESKIDDLRLWGLNFDYSEISINQMIKERYEQIKRSYISDFGEEVANAVDILTRRKEDTYNQYIDKVCKNKYATIVKIYDIRDNLDENRMTRFTDEHRESLKKRYEKALEKLEKARNEFDK